MEAVTRYSTTPGQRRLGVVLRRHVDNDELDLNAIDLAEEAEQLPNSRHAGARKLSTKCLG